MNLNLTSYFVKSLIVLFVILALLGCNSNKKENDWDKNNLEGKVKFITEISYEAKDRFGKIEKVNRKRKYDFINDYWNKYNKEGYLIEKKEFHSDGNLKLKNVYRYDDLGNILEGNEYNSDGSLLTNYINGYNDMGFKIETNYYNSKGKIEAKYNYKYDEKGNKVEVNKFNSGGNIETKYIYKFDEKGNKIEENKYNSDGIRVKRYTFKYDSKGKLLEESEFFSDGIKYVKKYNNEYDDFGNKINTKHYFTDYSSYKVVNIYNNKENEIERIFYDEYDIITSHYTYEYELDEERNWIKKIEFEDQIPTYILEREIEYY